MGGADARVDDAATDPAEALLQDEAQARLRVALQRLSPTWRSMLYMRDGLGYSYKQIAAALEKSEQVVGVTLHRARLRVRELLELEDPGLGGGAADPGALGGRRS